MRKKTIISFLTIEWSLHVFLKTLSPFHQRTLWTKFGWNWPVVLYKQIFKLGLYVLLFRYYFSLEKGVALHLNKLESPSPKDTACFQQNLVEICSGFWRRRQKMWKVYGQADRQKAISKAHLSYQIRWANKAFKLLLKSEFIIFMKRQWMYQPLKIISQKKYNKEFFGVFFQLLFYSLHVHVQALSYIFTQ